MFRIASHPRGLAVFAALLLCSVLATGCQTPPLTYSGFLQDYTQLTPNPERPDSALWREPGLDLGPYRRVMIDQPGIYYPKDETERLPPDVADKLTGELKTQLTAAFGTQFEIAQEPAPDTLRVRVALTNVRPSGVNSGPSVVVERVPVDLDDAHLEAEVMDSMTTKRLLTEVDSRRGRGMVKVSGQVRWEEVRSALRAWSQTLVQRLTAK